MGKILRVRKYEQGWVWISKANCASGHNQDSKRKCLQCGEQHQDQNFQADKQFPWFIISWLFQTCLNLQSMKKESRENSKKIKPKEKRKSFI